MCGWVHSRAGWVHSRCGLGGRAPRAGEAGASLLEVMSFAAALRGMLATARISRSCAGGHRGRGDRHGRVRSRAGRDACMCAYAGARRPAWRVCTMCARCACARGVRMLCTRAGRRRRTCLARLAFMASVSSGSGSGFATGLAFFAAGLLAAVAALSNSKVLALTWGGGEGERQGWRGGRGDGRGAGGGRGPVVGMPLVVVEEGRE